MTLHGVGVKGANSSKGKRRLLTVAFPDRRYFIPLTLSRLKWDRFSGVRSSFKGMHFFDLLQSLKGGKNVGRGIILYAWLYEASAKVDSPVEFALG